MDRMNETLSRDEYQKLKAMIGPDRANTIVDLKFGYTDEARHWISGVLAPAGPSTPYVQEYSSMSYEQAWDEAVRIVEQRGWNKNYERLAALHEIMKNRIIEKRYQLGTEGGIVRQGAA